MFRLASQLLCSSLLATLLVPSAGLTTDDGLLHAINHLLKYVEDSNCVFIRNDKEYTSKEAAKHLKTKYDFYMDNLKTPEDFIEMAATKSALSGKPYWVRCDGQFPMLSADWLTKELSNYRKLLHSDGLTK